MKNQARLLFNHNHSSNTICMIARFMLPILIGLMLCTSVLSLVLITSQTSHIHNQRGAEGCCSTCVQVQTMTTVVKQTGSSVIAMVGLGLVLLFMTNVLLLLNSLDFYSSLISLKVRLNY